MWSVIFGTVIALSVLGIVYLGFAVSRFGGIKKLSRGRRIVGLLISLGIVGVLFLIFKLTLSTVNAVMILLHEVLFFLLFGLIFRIAGKVRGRKTKYNWQGWLSVSLSAVWLTAGWVLCHGVWQTDYSLSTEKQLGELKIALIADSHIGTTFDGEGFAEHLKTIAEQSPDILFIAGDFADNSTTSEDLQKACEALGGLDLKYGVWYCYGNHDRGYAGRMGYTADGLEKALRDNGVHILEDECELVDGRFYVAGRKDKSRDRDRRDINSLLSGLDTEKYIIVLDHQPSDYDAEAASAADLVLSGHTHGGQLIPATYVGEWFGMNDRTYGHERRNDTDFIVTSGISDWEIKFKTGTKSEFVIISVEGK